MADVKKNEGVKPEEEEVPKSKAKDKVKNEDSKELDNSKNNKKAKKPKNVPIESESSEDDVKVKKEKKKAKKQDPKEDEIMDKNKNEDDSKTAKDINQAQKKGKAKDSSDSDSDSSSNSKKDKPPKKKANIADIDSDDEDDDEIPNKRPQKEDVKKKVMTIDQFYASLQKALSQTDSNLKNKVFFMAVDNNLDVELIESDFFTKEMDNVKNQIKSVEENLAFMSRMRPQAEYDEINKKGSPGAIENLEQIMIEMRTQFKHDLEDLASKSDVTKKNLEILENNFTSFEGKADRAAKAEAKVTNLEITSLTTKNKLEELFQKAVVKNDLENFKAKFKEELKGDGLRMTDSQVMKGSLVLDNNSSAELNTVLKQVNVLMDKNKKLEEGMKAMKENMEDLQSRKKEGSEDWNEREKEEMDPNNMSLKEQLRKITDENKELKRDFQLLRESVNFYRDLKVKNDSGENSEEKNRANFKVSECGEGLFFNDSQFIGSKPVEFIVRLFEGKIKSTSMLYNSTDHGPNPEAFHAMVKNAKNTLIVVKSGKFIAGGFTDQSWDGSGYKSSSKTFLFSFDNNKLYKQATPEISICCEPEFGPCFGSFLIRLFSNKIVT